MQDFLYYFGVELSTLFMMIIFLIMSFYVILKIKDVIVSYDKEQIKEEYLDTLKIPLQQIKLKSQKFTSPHDFCFLIFIKYIEQYFYDDIKKMNFNDLTTTIETHLKEYNQKSNVTKKKSVKKKTVKKSSKGGKKNG